MKSLLWNKEDSACNTGDGRVTLDNNFGEQLGIILHLLHNPEIPSYRHSRQTYMCAPDMWATVVRLARLSPSLSHLPLGTW